MLEIGLDLSQKKSSVKKHFKGSCRSMLHEYAQMAEKTTPFSVSLIRRQVLYQAAQLACCVLQTRLEEYLTLADGLPEDLVENTEKGREKDRRQVTREEKILQQKEEHVRYYSCGTCALCIFCEACSIGLDRRRRSCSRRKSM